jgi:hypothetical protein
MESVTWRVVSGGGGQEVKPGGGVDGEGMGDGDGDGRCGGALGRRPVGGMGGRL